MKVGRKPSWLLYWNSSTTSLSQTLPRAQRFRAIVVPLATNFRPDTTSLRYPFGYFPKVDGTRRPLSGNASVATLAQTSPSWMANRQPRKAGLPLESSNFDVYYVVNSTLSSPPTYLVYIIVYNSISIAYL